MVVMTGGVQLVASWHLRLHDPRDGQEDQLGALGLILNAVVLWNTRYTDTAINHLRAQGQTITNTEITRLSPLTDSHLNVHGRYSFTPPTSTNLRNLRDPNTPNDD
jgi:hypothetical protein